MAVQEANESWPPLVAIVGSRYIVVGIIIQ